MIRTLRFAVVFSVLAATAIASHAATSEAVPPGGRSVDGWSPDPAANLSIADRADDQVQPKLVPAADGSWFLSWYDNAAGGYDPALQRLDALGNEIWPHNGIVVADTSLSFTTDYGLAVDADGAALWAFRDDRGGAEHITAARIDPDGAALWGDEGLSLDAGGEFMGPPKIVGTADDEILVAWTHDSDIRVRRLDLLGRPIWDSDAVFVDAAGAQQMLSDLLPTPDGGAIVSWTHSQSFAQPRHLWAQKVDRDGAAQWGEPLPDGGRAPLVVFDAGTLQYGNFPPILSDHAGGGVFVWYETDPLLQVRVQHVRADGSLRFVEDGLLVAEPNPAIGRVEPVGAYDRNTGDLYVFWREMPDSGPLAQAMWAQRVTGDGQRAWGPGGIAIEPPAEHEVTQLAAEMFGRDVLVAYVETHTLGFMQAWIRRLDRDGEDVWPTGRVSVSSVASVKARLTLAAADDYAVLAWEDGRGGDADIYVQNVNADGSLGPIGGPTPTASPGPSTVEPPPSETPTPGFGRVFLPALGTGR